MRGRLLPRYSGYKVQYTYQQKTDHERETASKVGYKVQCTYQQKTDHEREIASEVVGLVLGGGLLVQFGEEVGDGGESGSLRAEHTLPESRVE